MKEIEIKARLREPAEVIAALEAKGCSLSEPVTQKDTVFVRTPFTTLDEYLLNDYFLRVRESSDGTVIFTAKYNPSRRHMGDTMTTEQEVTVGSAENTRGIIELLGFAEAVRIVKRRRMGHVGAFEICIDELEGAGSFIEIERCVPDDSEHDQITQAMRALLTELGITEEDLKVKRYDVQLLEQGGFV